ncbi:MAG: FAD-dependent oxidoreductase [Gracilimonas sp.]|nr:FAD-dependent oxidoreductase [Gracilimonas sp.]
MSTSNHFDFVVLGAGLAGLAVAKTFFDAGASICLVDIKDVASGASGTPLGLINPATGRWGKMVWEAEKCLNSVAEDLQNIAAFSSRNFYKKTGILRPAQDKKMAKRMRQNVDDENWPAGWCTWLDKSEVHQMNPNLHCVEGAMWMPEGLTVEVPTYLREKSKLLAENGTLLKTGLGYEITESGNNFTLSFIDDTEIHADSLVFTSGYETSESNYWKYLPLHPVKGQVATFESPETENFTYSLSALGYIASISKERFVAGSTYEHHYDHLHPDQDGLKYLKKRLGNVYPSLFENAELVSQWAGVRASTPNKKPVVGSHPEKKNVHILTGLGSKGLIYSVYLSQLLWKTVTRQEPLPHMLSVGRF